jgi:hypothetical protein
VLLGTNTKLTPMHGIFVLVCSKVTLTHASIHVQNSGKCFATGNQETTIKNDVPLVYFISSALWQNRESTGAQPPAPPSSPQPPPHPCSALQERAYGAAILEAIRHSHRHPQTNRSSPPSHRRVGCSGSEGGRRRDRPDLGVCATAAHRPPCATMAWRANRLRSVNKIHICQSSPSSATAL